MGDMDHLATQVPGLNFWNEYISANASNRSSNIVELESEQVNTDHQMYRLKRKDNFFLRVFHSETCEKIPETNNFHLELFRSKNIERLWFLMNVYFSFNQPLRVTCIKIYRYIFGYSQPPNQPTLSSGKLLLNEARRRKMSKKDQLSDVYEALLNRRIGNIFFFENEKDITLRSSFLDPQLWYELPTYSALKAAREGKSKDSQKNQKHNEETDAIKKEMCLPSDEEELEEKDAYGKIIYLKKGTSPSNESKRPVFNISSFSSKKTTDQLSNIESLRDASLANPLNRKNGSTNSQRNVEDMDRKGDLPNNGKVSIGLSKNPSRLKLKGLVAIEQKKISVVSLQPPSQSSSSPTVVSPQPPSQSGSSPNVVQEEKRNEATTTKPKIMLK